MIKKEWSNDLIKLKLTTTARCDTPSASCSDTRSPVCHARPVHHWAPSLAGHVRHPSSSPAMLPYPVCILQSTAECVRDECCRILHSSPSGCVSEFIGDRRFYELGATLVERWNVKMVTRRPRPWRPEAEDRPSADELDSAASLPYHVLIHCHPSSTSNDSIV